MIARRLVIRGRVQGVGYRDAMVDAARGYGVTGWVRNHLAGTVEAFVQGEPGAVEQVLAWCWRGPRLARVTEVEVVPEEPDSAQAAFVRHPTC
jgi:acylphosphatase